MSYRIIYHMSYRIISYRTVSYHIISYRITYRISYHISYNISYQIVKTRKKAILTWFGVWYRHFICPFFCDIVPIGWLISVRHSEISDASWDVRIQPPNDATQRNTSEERKSLLWLRRSLKPHIRAFDYRQKDNSFSWPSFETWTSETRNSSTKNSIALHGWHAFRSITRC